jgi:divalent metal cation (Fe/Co/Zn/Cd) transporter
VAATRRLWHEAPMARRNHAAGGFFLVLAILGGFAWGAMSGMPYFGALVGTAIGIVIATIVWLVDRSRGA